MLRAGTVVRTTGGVAVVRSVAAEQPAIGTGTVDERLEDTGEIVDVFGPVEKPYLAVSPPADRGPGSLVGETLYIRD
jgi:RNA-binding protein